MRTLYVFSFTLLGILIQFLFHAALEIQVIKFFTEVIDPASVGLSWDMLFIIHHIGSIVFLIGGAYVGFREGEHWWCELYVKRKSGLWHIGKKIKK